MDRDPAPLSGFTIACGIFSLLAYCSSYRQSLTQGQICTDRGTRCYTGDINITEAILLHRYS